MAMCYVEPFFSHDDADPDALYELAFVFAVRFLCFSVSCFHICAFVFPACFCMWSAVPCAFFPANFSVLSLLDRVRVSVRRFA